MCRADPVGVAHRLRRAGDDEKAVGRLADDGQVALEAAALVQQRGVDHLVHRHVDVVGAQPLQHRQCIASLQQQLAEAALVVQRHRFARGALLVDHPVEPAGAAERVQRPGRAGGLEVVGALPAVLAPNSAPLAASRSYSGLHAQRPPGDQFLTRPAHRVVQAQRFAGAFGQRLAVGGEGREAADVHVPQVAGRFAADHPLGDQPPRPAAVGDARRVEAGADEVAAQFGRLAEDEVAVGREALRPVEQHLHRRRLQARRAVHGVLHQRLELLPVLVQQLELEGRWNRLHAPGLGHGLEAAHQQPADLFLVVDEAVRVAHHRQHRVHALDAVGDDVEVLGRVQRHVHAGQPPELPRPLAGTVDQCFAAHFAQRGVHAGHPATLDDHAGDLDVLHQRRAAQARALGQAHAQVGRVGLAVAGDPDARPAGRRCAAAGTGRRLPSA